MKSMMFVCRNRVGDIASRCYCVFHYYCSMVGCSGWKRTWYVPPPFFTLVLIQANKGKEMKWTCITAYHQYNSTTKRSDVDNTELPAYTPHLLFLRINIRYRATLLLTVSPI